MSPRKISYQELLEMLADEDTKAEDLKPYLEAELHPDTGLAPVLVPNPELVTGTEADEARTEGALILKALNGAYKQRRRKSFFRRLRQGSTAPILLAEGDSWFEFPIWLEDTIDHLNKDHLIFCLSEAGDELKGMVAEAEYVDVLENLVGKLDLNIRAVLLSGGGNDIVGKPLHDFLRNYQPGAAAGDLIVKTKFRQRLEEIIENYKTVIGFINRTYPDTPIFIHSYDHAVPLPAQGLKIPPKDGWLGKWFRKRGFPNGSVQAEVVKELIDRFHGALETEIAGAADLRNVHLVDCRGIVGDDWNDELHPTDEGFARVADKFRKAFETAGVYKTTAKAG